MNYIIQKSRLQSLSLLPAETNRFMFNWFSEPYAEYSLRSSLSEEELRDGLKRECLATKDLFLSRRGIRAVWNQASFHFVLKEKKQEILLQPVGKGRNSLRGIIHINFERATCKSPFKGTFQGFRRQFASSATRRSPLRREALGAKCSERAKSGQSDFCKWLEDSSAFDETVLNIVIRPDESCRPLLFFFLVFGILFEIAGIAVAMRDPKGFVFMIAPFIMFLGVCGIMTLCRSMAENETPLIRETFETILGVIEKGPSS